MTTPQKSNKQTLLRVNVGFLLGQGAGYSREVIFDYPDPFHIEDVLFSNLDGTLRLSRTPQGVLVQGKMIAEINTECTRCLTIFSLPFEIEINELFVLHNSPKADDEDAYIIDEGGHIDLKPSVREEGILSVPIQVLCEPDCKGLCAQCGQNLNEGACDCETDDIDPRLAVLRTLLDEE